jgi:hypothetical protein
MQVNAAGGTVSATVKLQGSLDGTAWEDIASVTPAAAGSTFAHSDGAKAYPLVRASISSYANGTIDALIYATGSGSGVA